MAKPNPIHDAEELKKILKLRERELRETQAELEKLKKESEREKAELRQKYEGEHQLRLQQEETYQERLVNLGQELEAEREMGWQLEVRYKQDLGNLRQELEAEREMRRQQEAEHRAAAVQVLCEVGADLKETHRDGRRTELHWAAERGDTHRVQGLLHAGSQVNAVDPIGCTPLYLAALGGRLDACRALLAAGARLDVKGGPSGWTTLHVAARHGHPAVCQLLLAAGARPNEPDDDEQWTALHCAAEEGHAPVVQLLLQHGAQRGAKDKKGRTALDLARQNGRISVAVMLQS